MKRNSVYIARFGILLFVILVLAAIITTYVVANYVRNSDDVNNTFEPAVSVNPVITEDFDDYEKKDVSFNPGDTGYPVYVRATIVVTWKDQSGNVYFSVPEKGVDYTLDLNLGGSGWVEGTGDGFYYYTYAVESNADTPVLIESSEQLKPAPESGYTLSVEIIVQTVQAVGKTDDDNTDAWKDAWKNFPSQP